jgi:hypothetical protein
MLSVKKYIVLRIMLSVIMLNVVAPSICPRQPTLMFVGKPNLSLEWSNSQGNIAL